MDEEYNLRLETGPPSGFVKLVGELHYTGPIPVSSSGNAVVSERTVIDASLVVDLAQIPAIQRLTRSRRLLISFLGRNLSDQSVRDARGFPQPGRMLGFGLKGAW